MVRLEEKEFEDLIIQSRHYVAVPVELFQYATDGSLEIISYSFCESVAREFEKQFSASPFSREARDFLYSKLTPVMAELGYSSKQSAERVFTELRADASVRTAGFSPAEIISTLAGEAWGEIALDEFSLDISDPCDRMAVVKADGKIVCYAGLNDEIDGDGLAEITVECDAEYRNRGYGAACVALLAEHLHSHGKTVKYICAEGNLASLKTAMRAGLTPYRRFMPYVCRLNNPDGSENEEITFNEV